MRACFFHTYFAGSGRDGSDRKGEADPVNKGVSGKGDNMKRDFLKNLDLGEGARLPDAAIDAIMAEHGKTVNPLQETITGLTGEKDTLQHDERRRGRASAAAFVCLKHSQKSSLAKERISSRTRFTIVKTSRKRPVRAFSLCR